MSIEVVEYTDTQCVWAWSSEPKLRWLRARYGEQLRWRRVFGVQVHDVSLGHPELEPEAAAEAFRAGWIDVSGHTGAPIAHAIEWESASSRRAAQTARAAERQGPLVAERVLRRLRETIFVAGQPIASPSGVVEALAGVDGLDLPRLLEDAGSPAVREAIRADYEETRDPDPEVIGLEFASPNPGAARPAGNRLRYGFPTLILRGPAGRRIVPGWRSAETYDDAVRAVDPQLAPLRGPALGADEALEHYRSLTLAELELLTGSQLPPLGAVPIVTATAPLFVHRDDIERGAFARVATARSVSYA